MGAASLVRELARNEIGPWDGVTHPMLFEQGKAGGACLPDPSGFAEFRHRTPR
ncbi:MAG TPA: hypothetical protein VE398_16245 [Acidobacteriota bacterium]|nr:hypothetical protein [Acidobacteriota bacterium]